MATELTHVFKSGYGGETSYYDNCEERTYLWCHCCLSWVLKDKAGEKCDPMEVCHVGR